jgi:hypothetical protein
LNVSNLLKPNGKHILLFEEIFNTKVLESIKFTRNLSMFDKIGYLSVYKNENCEIYEYNITALNKGNAF